MFPCSQVQAAFTQACSVDGRPSYVYPQSFNIDPDRLSVERRTADRSAFRASLGLGLCCHDILILGCGGSGDLRKGVDLFIHAARDMALSSRSATRKIVLAWAGYVGSSFREWAEKDMNESAYPTA